VGGVARRHVDLKWGGAECSRGRGPIGRLQYARIGHHGVVLTGPDLGAGSEWMWVMTAANASDSGAAPLVGRTSSVVQFRLRDLQPASTYAVRLVDQHGETAGPVIVRTAALDSVHTELVRVRYVSCEEH